MTDFYQMFIKSDQHKNSWARTSASGKRNWLIPELLLNQPQALHSQRP